MRTAKQIRVAITAVVAAAGKIQTEIHEIALECLEHAKEHGDITLIDKLIKELEANAPGQRTATLREWVETFSPVRWNNKSQEVGLLKAEAKNFTPFDLETAGKTPYYSMGKEQRPRELTLEQIIKMAERQLTRIEKAEKGEGKVVIAEGENVDKMKSVARAIAVAAREAAGNDNAEEATDETTTEEATAEAA